MKVFLGSSDNDADIDETGIVKCSVGADVSVEVAVLGVPFKGLFVFEGVVGGVY